MKLITTNGTNDPVCIRNTNIKLISQFFSNVKRDYYYTDRDYLSVMFHDKDKNTYAYKFISRTNIQAYEFLNSVECDGEFTIQNKSKNNHVISWMKIEQK